MESVCAHYILLPCTLHWEQKKLRAQEQYLLLGTCTGPWVLIAGLGWKNVILCGFGKGAGVALYAALMKLIPQPVGKREQDSTSHSSMFSHLVEAYYKSYETVILVVQIQDAYTSWWMVFASDFVYNDVQCTGYVYLHTFWANPSHYVSPCRCLPWSSLVQLSLIWMVTTLDNVPSLWSN